MSEFAIGCFLFGATFGMRYRVMVLLPLTLFLGVSCAFIAALSTLPATQVLLDFAVCALALQGGYVLGSIARFTTAAARAGRDARTFAQSMKTAR